MVEVSSDQKVAFLAHFATKPTFLGVSGTPILADLAVWDPKSAKNDKNGVFCKNGHFGDFGVFGHFWQIWPIWSFLPKVVSNKGKNKGLLAKSGILAQSPCIFPI